MKIKEALQNLVYLHTRESGQPTSEQWFKAVGDAEEALRKEQEQEQEMKITSKKCITDGCDNMIHTSPYCTHCNKLWES